MRFHKIEKNDISNGPGLRVSIFFSGCEIHCPGCFNKESWDYNSGTPFTELHKNEIFKIFQGENSKYYAGISILGGDPLAPLNSREVLAFCAEFKMKFPDKTIWLWTGRIYEEIDEDLSDIDVLIDGPYIEELYDPTLQYRGSSNQRIIKLR